MRNVRWIVAAGALSVALSSGCKKDTPPAPPAPAAKPAEPPAAPPAGEGKTPEGEKPAEVVKTPEGEKPVEAKPAEPVVGEVKPAEVPAVAPTAAGPAGALGAGLADVPGDVIAVASAPGVDALFNLVKGKADKFAVPFPMAKEQLLDQAKTMLGFSAIDWFDTTKSVHAIVWSINKDPSPVILFPITSKEKLIAALPADKKEGEQGNAFGLTFGEKPAFLNFLDGYAVITKDATAFAAAKDFATKVGALTPNGEADIRVATGNLRTIYAEQLAAVRGQLDSVKATIKQQLQGDPALGMQGPFAGIPGLDGILDWYFDVAATVMDEADGVAISADFDDAGNVQIPFTLRYKADGKIASLAKSLEGADLSFVSAAPASSYLIFASEFDPKSMGGLMDFAQDMLGTVLGLSDAEKATVKTQMEIMLTLSAKKAWFSIYPDGTFPLAMAGATHVTDGKAYQAVYDSYMNLLFTKAVEKIKPLLPPQFQAMDISTFGKLIEAANGISQNAGVKLAATTGDVDGVPTSKLTIEFDLEKVGAMLGPDKTAEIKKFTDVVGTRLEFAIAFGADKVGMAFGPNGGKNAAAAANGTIVGGTDTAGFTKGAAMLMHLDASKALEAWRPIVALADAEDAAALPVLPAGTYGGFAIGAGEGAINMSIYANVDAIAQAGMAAMRPKMEEPPAPVEGGAVPVAPEGGAVAPAPVPAPEAPVAPVPAPEAAPEGGGAKAGAGVIPQ